MVVIEATYTVYALVETNHAWLQLFVQPTWTTNVSITIHQDTYSKLHHHYKCYKNFHHHEETFSPAPTPPSQPRRGGRHRCPNTSTSILT